ncbi:MAG: hypothetical protein ACYDCO_18065 [Armatimonadota bacterium]
MHMNTRTLLLTVLLASSLLPALAMDGKVWLAAYQAYLRKDYATAHQGFATLLQSELTDKEKEEILQYDADCLGQLKKPAEAAAAWEALFKISPDTPRFDGLAILYRYYLDTGELLKAGALWHGTIKRWGGIAGTWKMIAEHTDYLAQRDPSRVVEVAALLAPLTIAKEDLIVAFYRPLFRYGHYEKAKEAHALLQQYYAKHRPEAVELDKRAYEDAISEDIVDTVFANFTKALDADDLEAARTWLANLNATVPEHPRAIEARKLYRTKMAAPKTEK